ncbi:MAG: Octaprenyl diphosphate synthase [Verrucomicrobia subdivision 3 bacterium]|nr:Octaprenyl diphosphate synthase [Limisphaerales bacterium]MCS1417822.1 Octaprenyl diphosphate synthase [Limisphaerales bacterium]
MLASKANLAQPPFQNREPITPTEMWHQLVKPCQGFLDDVSATLQRQVETFEPEIANHAQYVISNPGKRLRPLLVGLAGGADRCYDSSLVEIGAIIEMIHLATLVHDDILDAAEIRHNRPTLSAMLNNDVTVLLGDCLFAHALKLATTFPTTLVCAAVAQATKRVCSGEILQTLNGTHKPSRTEYLRVIEMKTAELFGLSCDLGARYGSACPEAAEQVRNFGLALGTAYQIYDDCLDVFSSEKATGKSLGTDLIKGKYTLPILILLEEAPENEKSEIVSKLNQWDRCHTNWLMTFMNRHQVLVKSADVVRMILGDSRACLSLVERSHPVAALYKLSDFLELKITEMAPRETSD